MPGVVPQLPQEVLTPPLQMMLYYEAPLLAYELRENGLRHNMRECACGEWFHDTTTSSHVIPDIAPFCCLDTPFAMHLRCLSQVEVASHLLHAALRHFPLDIGRWEALWDARPTNCPLTPSSGEIGMRGLEELEDLDSIVRCRWGTSRIVLELGWPVTGGNASKLVQ